LSPSLALAAVESAEVPTRFRYWQYVTCQVIYFSAKIGRFMLRVKWYLSAERKGATNGLHPNETELRPYDFIRFVVFWM
jgi:hypothetical protein